MVIRSEGGELLFQSTPPARGATWTGAVCQGRGGISIHAPREGGDLEQRAHFNRDLISIHAPREGGDRASILSLLFPNRFQSTPPREGGDGIASWWKTVIRISIHAPREGGDVNTDVNKAVTIISIHAPREGGDIENQQRHIEALIFQSTPPARGATHRPF